MKDDNEAKRIAIIGGGPSGLFMYKRCIESGTPNLEITIFEKKSLLGVGMPYSCEGANMEHITNVSANEIPQLACSLSEWVNIADPALLKEFNIDADRFNEYKVLPRLFFGAYLNAQFELLKEKADLLGIDTKVRLQTVVKDVIDQVDQQSVAIIVEGEKPLIVDHVIICTGHNWPKKYEEKIPSYFDSPYPPTKLALAINHPVAIKGSSLTAIDALRTLARKNGAFTKDAAGKLSFQLNDDSPNFRLVMHSKNGMLPAVRFHLEDSHLQPDSLLTVAEIVAHKAANNGFLSLDFIFEKNFKEIFKEKDPTFYEQIKDYSIEEFVEVMMELRERLDPFVLLKAEYAEASKSIKRQQSIYWKEMLAVLSFAMNYPAKYLSAEDMQRLQKVLMPLISIVIAFVPQSSCEEMIALHDAGVLTLVAVGEDSKIIPEEKGGAFYEYLDEAKQWQKIHYHTFVDCVGQPHLNLADFPFKSLVREQRISQAYLKFRSAAVGKEMLDENPQGVLADQSGNFYLKVPGIAITDYFQAVDPYGAANNRIFIMAVPYIGGFNPDYSGLDFCEEASAGIQKILFDV